MFRHLRPSGLTLCLAALCLTGLRLNAQSAPASEADKKAADATPKTDEQVVKLSPFEVNTTKDKGYYVANSTSGTMLNTALQDLPMPIQVIDSQFISDIGATNLKNALKYTSGIQLQSFNTVGVGISSFSNQPGKLNNPEGNTANASQVTVKYRGFETISVLRDGFARGNSADEVNIDRIELVGGPQALLYGVSNFGGVVNYYVKQPQDKPASDYSVSYGSYNFVRGTMDVTGPISKTLAYRLTGAYQQGDSWTDFNSEKHYFISPVLQWKPFERTKITLDAEYGHQNRSGTGWQNLRAAPGFINQSQNVEFGFLGLNGRSPRTFRWSGPDTYNHNTAENLEFKVEQELAHNLNFWAGFNRSTFKYSQLDNMAALMPAGNFAPGSASPVPDSAVSIIHYVLLDPSESGVGYDPSPVPSTIAYQWQGIKESTASNQLRANLVYTFNLFENSKWLKSEHALLGGVTYQRNTDSYHSRQTPGNVANFHSPADSGYFHYGKQANGQPDQGMTEWDNHIIATPDRAAYAIYQGKFLDNRLTLIAGVRHDRSFTSTWAYSPEFDSFGNRSGSGPGITVPNTTRSADSSNRTLQWGVSFAVVPGLNVFGMNSGGFSPNYSGVIGVDGQPLGATMARDSEVGIKFDLGQGKVSGSVSFFTINRTHAQVAVSSSTWNPPAMFGGKVHYDSGKDIVFMLGSSGSAGTMVDGGGSKITDASANMWAPNSSGLWANSNLSSLWDAGVNAGAIYQKQNAGGNTNWYVDTTKAAGNAYLTSFYNVGAQAAQADGYGGWYGWFWDVDSVTNNPSSDQFGNSLAQLAGGAPGAIVGSDRSSGFDANILLRPTDNLQVVLGWTYTKRVVVNGGDWIKYPTGYGAEFAPWNTPWYSWLTGANGTDATGRSALTGQRADDAPRNQGSVWVQYTVPENSEMLKGWAFGAGAVYTGPRAWFTGVVSNVTTPNGAPLDLKTPAMTVYNCMLRYSFKVGSYPSSLQLNVDNVVNNRSLTLPGVWRDPRTWSLNFSTHF
jgi:outer membrane receptor for ferric coprogen and ferric-rhodotorulic acid